MKRASGIALLVLVVVAIAVAIRVGRSPSGGGAGSAAESGSRPPPKPASSPGGPGSLSAGSKSGATVEVPTIFGFKAPIQEGNKMVAQVSGKEAKPSLLAGQVQVTEFRLETYRYAPDRETELVVESPLGVFGPSGADSDRAITLRSADGRFGITGVGWGWNRNTGLLVISNKVETALRRPGTATNRPPIALRSQRFEYNIKTGDARFIGECEAHEPGQARLHAGELSARLDPRAEKPDSITATNGVTLDLLRPERPGQATGSGAVYSMTPDGERIELSGPASWKFSVGEGSADHLVLLPAKDSYAARGHARLSLQAPDRATNAAAKAAGPKNSAPLLVAAESIEGGPREVVFQGPVTASQGDRLELKAGHVVASLEPGPASAAASGSAAAATPRPSHVVATEGVQARILAGGSPVMLRGGRMIYTLGEHDMIEVLENPAWDSALHSGKADRFVLHPEVPSFQAVENVGVTWRTAADKRATNALPVEISARLLRVEPRAARFSGGVTAQRGTYQLKSTDLDLGLATNSVLSGFAARGGVILDYQASLPKAAPAATPPATPATATNTVRGHEALSRFIATTIPEAQRWRITAVEVVGAFAAGQTEPSSIDATGGVKVENPNIMAAGGRLNYRAGDGLLRLTEDARLRTLSGVVIEGEPGTSLVLDPRTERFSVDGRWRRMSLPSEALRGGVSTNRAKAR